MATNNLLKIHERLTVLETAGGYQSKKLNEIHKALIGNGQPGLLAEWNQWKGGVKLFGTAISLVIAGLTTCLGYLVYIK